MSEVLARLIARVHSDISRGIAFDKGMQHFTDLIEATLTEMDARIEKMEKLAGVKR